MNNIGDKFGVFVSSNKYPKRIPDHEIDRALEIYNTTLTPRTSDQESMAKALAKWNDDILVNMRRENLMLRNQRSK